MEKKQNIPNCQTWDKNVTSQNLKNVSQAKKKESILTPDQRKRDTDTVISEGWKLGKDASLDVEDVL